MNSQLIPASSGACPLYEISQAQVLLAYSGLAPQQPWFLLLAWVFGFPSSFNSFLRGAGMSSGLLNF
jgi:hypothetical protein